MREREKEREKRKGEGRLCDDHLNVQIQTANGKRFVQFNTQNRNKGDIIKIVLKSFLILYRSHIRIELVLAKGPPLDIS